MAVKTEASNEVTEPTQPKKTAFWEHLRAHGDEHGHFHGIGDNHSVLFVDQSPNLIVTFEDASKIEPTSNEAQLMGVQLLEGNDHSLLSIISHEESPFHEPALFHYFDRLVDDGFFEDFDKVLFLGCDLGAYAAAAYSVTSPQATVIAIDPIATLDAELTPWETRYPKFKRTRFTDRYGFAPQMASTAQDVFVLYDPSNIQTSMHAALFYAPNTHRIACRHMTDAASILWAADILSHPVRAFFTKTLRPNMFHKILKFRQTQRRYLRGLEAKLSSKGHFKLALQLCNAVIEIRPLPYFRNRAPQLVEIINGSESAVYPTKADPAPEGESDVEKDFTPQSPRKDAGNDSDVDFEAINSILLADKA